MRRLYFSMAMFIAAVLTSYIGSRAVTTNGETKAEISQNQGISQEGQPQDTVEITSSSARETNNFEKHIQSAYEN